MVKNRQLNVVQLYPEQMNIYGDNGNTQIVTTRAQLYGCRVVNYAYNSINDKDKLLKADIVLGGGGQDSGQLAILDDMQKVKADLEAIVQDNVPMLVICGLYQLFGHYFMTKDGRKLTGVSIFDLVTNGSDKRLIGDIIVDTDDFGRLIGYENHSGLTDLANKQAALGQVVVGYGNNGQTGVEGARINSAIGTYLHGPALSKNPRLADWLIRMAVERKYGQQDLRPVNQDAKQQLAVIDDLSKQARAVIELRN